MFSIEKVLLSQVTFVRDGLQIYSSERIQTKICRLVHFYCPLVIKDFRIPDFTSLNVTVNLKATHILCEQINPAAHLGVKLHHNRSDDGI